MSKVIPFKSRYDIEKENEDVFESEEEEIQEMLRKQDLELVRKSIISYLEEYEDKLDQVVFIAKDEEGEMFKLFSGDPDWLNSL